MNTTSNVSYIDFQKKNLTAKKIYNTWYDKWLHIKRACDPSKTIVQEAIAFIAAIEFLFFKNPNEIIFNKELLKKKCKQGPRQRSRFLTQLADIYEITPRTSYNYKGKKYHFVYSAKRTKNSLEILKNPEEFYKKCQSKIFAIPDKNVVYPSQKCLVSPTNLTTTYTANHNSSQGLQEHRNIIETYIETDLADLGGLLDKNGELQDQQNQFQNERLLQDQGICVNMESQVEDIPTIEIAWDSKGSVPIEQSADTTSKSFMREIVRDLDLDYDYRSITVGDTQYMVPRRVEEVKCYHFKDMAKEYLTKLKAQREQDNNLEPTKGEDITPNKPQEVISTQVQEQPVEIVQTDNKLPKESNPIRPELRKMTIYQMREEMAKVKASKQVITKPQRQVHSEVKQETAYTKTNYTGTYHNKLLKEFKLNHEVFDAIRLGSNKPHFSDDRITAVVQNIITNNPETRIWGGKHAFIRYMIKAINHEKEYIQEEMGESIADKNRQYNEELRYQFDNNIILLG